MDGRTLRTGDRQLIKDINISLAVNAIRQFGPISRVDVARLTGLGRSTVSGIVGLLLKEGFVREIGNAQQDPAKPSVGRPPVMVEFNPSARFVVAVKLAPMSITAAVTDLDAEVIGSVEMPTGTRLSESAIRERISEAVNQAISNCGVSTDKIVGMGVAMPGIVDSRTGVSISPQFFLWQNLPLRNLLEEEFGVPVFIDNDANAATLAEKWKGHGRGASNFVCVTVGIGIGAGIIIDNKLYRGAIAGAGEIGHITIDEDGPECMCGNRGCLEAFAADAAIIREMNRVIESGQESVVSRIAASEGREIDRSVIARAAAAGDSAALSVVRQAGEHIGVGLATLVNILNPEMIVVAGEAALDFGGALLEPMRDSIRRRSMGVLAQRLEVVESSLGANIWIVGAASLVLDDFFGAPIYERRERVAAVSIPELMQGS
ncbi:MAG: ROK family protein [Clostridia bacterium]|nr:ROK family protein [Clostridia bacterium]